jgi:hypothetical protein
MMPHSQSEGGMTPGSKKWLHRLNHAEGKISAEFPNLAVRAVLLISTMDQFGSFSMRAAGALCDVPGFSAVSFDDIKTILAAMPARG